MARGEDIEELRKLAEKRFLGRSHVVGVGIGREKAERLVFLLRTASGRSEAEIRRWARRSGVEVEIKVVGEIRPLNAARAAGGGYEHP